MQDSNKLTGTNTIEKILESVDKDPIHVSLPSGKAIKLKGYVSMHALLKYEGALNLNKTPREAFVELLHALTDKETPVTANEIAGLSDDELISLGLHYLNNDSHLKEFYDKFESEENFFERFKQSQELRRKEFAEKINRHIPDISKMLPQFKLPILNSMQNIESVYSMINKTSRESQIYKDSLLDGVKNIAPPSTKTNNLLNEMIRQQDEYFTNNQEIQKEMVSTLVNMLKLQAEMIEENRKSGEKTTLQNWTVICISTVALVVSVIAVLATLYPGELKGIISKISNLSL